MISIVIPARNEEWLQNTIDDILLRARGDVEILVGLDGWKTDIKSHEKVKVIYEEKPIGQRAMQNNLVRMSKGEYVMKADAHIAFSEGFDVEMLKAVDRDTVVVPQVCNLHVFDWVCKNCGARHYQGLKPNARCCDWQKDVKWSPQPKPIYSTFYFDTNFIFRESDLITENAVEEVMNLQGMCFLVNKETYWEKELCDENLGSWGAQGVEISLKTWLSGGRVVCTKNAWIAHFFRKYEEFPYQRDMGQVHNAQLTVRDMFLNNKWPKQTRSLGWLVSKFNFPCDWTPDKLSTEQSTQ